MRVKTTGLRWRPHVGRLASLATVWLALGCGRADSKANKQHPLPPESAEVQPTAANIPVASSPQDLWFTDLEQAVREAGTKNKPLLVVSLLGDLKQRC